VGEDGILMRMRMRMWMVIGRVLFLLFRQLMSASMSVDMNLEGLVDIDALV